MKLYNALVVVNAVCGSVLASGGTLTALLTGAGAARVAAVVLSIVGVVQLIASAVVHSVSGPPTPTPAQPPTAAH